jgi:hypothetical protein
VFMTGSKATAQLLSEDGRWTAFSDRRIGAVWTDDFSNLLSVLH